MTESSTNSTVSRTWMRRGLRALTSAALVAAGLTVAGALTATSAAAAPGPVAQRGSGTVTADALPTAQIDGVVWSQAVVGNTVYAGGKFGTARPAGAAAGTNTVTRNNLMSYDITTGALNTAFAPSLNGEVKVVAASPDGSRVYVGGAFTTADGQTRYRLAAYSTATGQLISSFAPYLDAEVNAIVVTNTTVYVGGAFSNANGVARARLAAFSPSDGSLLNWAPTADNNEVEAMVMAPGGAKLIVGGSFTTLNSSASAYGMGALDPTSGALLPWAVSSTVRDAGANAAILSLSTDGTAVYGSGYVFGSGGNLEGSFSAAPGSGAINWIEDCHGDTYSTFPTNNTVYVVGHAHDCTTTGDYPQTNPWSYHHALAWTANATGTLLHNQVSDYADFGGQPSPSMINWFPDMDEGTATGQSQAAWNVTGNSQYVVLGGEFPTVNGVGQQGLVRFAVPSVAPKQQGPMVAGYYYQPTLTAISSTSVRISWPANWDRDDQNLTYKLVRNGDFNHPIYTTTATSQFWNTPPLSYVDTGLSPGTSYQYNLLVNDPDGNVARGDYASVTTPTTNQGSYAQQVLRDNATDYWRLDQASGSTAADTAGNHPLVEQSGITHGAAGAIIGDSDTAEGFSGTTTGSSATTTAVPGPNTFSIEGWFSTTTTSGGKIVGFGSASTGVSTSYDRQVYMDNAGHLVFGVYNNATSVATSTATYKDGKWHQVVATLSSAGMVLYVDGAKVAANTAATSGQAYSGFWRLGGDNLNSWPSTPTSRYFRGSIDDVAIYPTALTLAQIQDHYTKSGRTPTGPAAPTAAFTSSCTNLTCSFDASGSKAAGTATVKSYSWAFGDNTTGSGVTASHAYSSANTYSVTLTVTDSLGATSTVTHTVTPSAPANKAPTAAFTSSCTNLACSFNGSGSSDADGTVASYAWSYGDNATGSGASTSHTYAAAGSYTVTLTVTDNQGATGSVTHTVSPTAAPVAPTASWTSACAALGCSFDASGSSAGGGATIKTYAWNFGDSSTASSVKPSHSYARAGTYTVALTVTDSNGRTASASKSVTVSSAVIADAFGRTVSNGWGSADTGGAWSADSPEDYAVSSGDGRMTLSGPGAGTGIGLAGVSQSSLNMLLDTGISAAATGNGVMVSIGVRHTSAGEYRLKVRYLPGGDVHLVIAKQVGADETVLQEVDVPSVTYQPGTMLRARFQISGTTTATLTGRIWAVGTTEPTVNQISVTDSDTALRSAGSLYVQGYLSGSSANAPVAVLFDNLSATTS